MSDVPCKCKSNTLVPAEECECFQDFKLECTLVAIQAALDGDEEFCGRPE